MFAPTTRPVSFNNPYHGRPGPSNDPGPADASRLRLITMAHFTLLTSRPKRSGHDTSFLRPKWLQCIQSIRLMFIDHA